MAAMSLEEELKQARQELEVSLLWASRLIGFQAGEYYAKSAEVLREKIARLEAESEKK